MKDEKYTRIKELVSMEDLLSHYNIELNDSGKALCPFHNEKTPSLSIKDNRFKCFGCGVSGDVIDFVCLYQNMTTLEALDYLRSIAGLPKENIIKKQGTTSTNTIEEYLKSCISNVDKTDYFKKRGLDSGTVHKYHLGYDINKQMAIFPYSSDLRYYQSRSIKTKRFYKPKTSIAGREPLYNEKTLFNKEQVPVFIVESPLCALSIMQSGGAYSVSLCGTGINKIRNILGDSGDIAPMIISLDNDEPGKLATDELIQLLKKNKVKYIASNIAGKYKDPNELLIHNPEQLQKNIKSAIRKIKKTYMNQYESAEDFQLLEAKPVTWIVKDLLPIGLAIICAPAKSGKSWMMLQLGFCVAKGDDFLGHTTIQSEGMYYALEDSRGRIKDRINKILEYKRAPKALKISLTAEDMDGNFIGELQRLLQLYPQIKLIIVDTLQKIRGRVTKIETAYTSDYREMGIIKKFADDNNVCILLVHHLRKKIDSDVFNMISGSNGLMGACDTVMIISRKNRIDEHAILSVTGRDIGHEELALAFNKDKFKWRVEGNIQEIEKNMLNTEYNNSVVIKTIKNLLVTHSGEWQGSASEILKKSIELTGKQCCTNSILLGKEISRFTLNMKEDKIDYKYLKSGNFRIHKFSIKE